MTASLTDILTMEELDKNLFRSLHHRENFRNILFGGQVLAQALISAYKTVNNMPPHSLHAYFLRAGSADAPVIYDVENVRDGTSFKSRRVVARQFGRPIFNMAVSFHQKEEGYEHQKPLPLNVDSPEKILEKRGITSGRNVDAHIPASKSKTSGEESPFQLLAVEDDVFFSTDIHPPEALYWIKSTEPLPDDPIYHYCSLAFASDFGLLATALLPHKTNLFDDKMVAASVDHAMWFHTEEFRVDKWLLCQTQSPWAGNARGLTHGNIFNDTGKLIASTAQEGLIRPI
ncbi:acyl-CoA thioesterase II [Teredinibacter sp. KSP-S5-2]|uniref:acyl-CoA thioesterase n=1 Tax=Teredinibacter sp. KSP-S5-2 TaxID=3034506 RepID=UPI002934CF28|nr:acyl-CoA thioesterase II [Teredinibacter sp. KSP-S5-2]WNO11394.1 acyl-CoA thioesterase II [Teredinibacter sp. KSP-S5-2]